MQQVAECQPMPTGRVQYISEQGARSLTAQQNVVILCYSKQGEGTDGPTCRQVALVIMRFGVRNSCAFFSEGTEKVGYFSKSAIISKKS